MILEDHDIEFLKEKGYLTTETVILKAKIKLIYQKNSGDD